MAPLTVSLTAKGIPMRAVLIAALIALPSAAFSAEVLTRGTISWSAACKGKFPTEIRFEKHNKPGRVEVVHDGEDGSVDMNADGSFGADKLAGQAGQPKTLIMTGSIYQGTVTRQDCTGSFSAK